MESAQAVLVLVPLAKMEPLVLHAVEISSSMELNVSLIVESTTSRTLNLTLVNHAT